MRKPLSKNGARLVGAGLSSGAVVAALLVAPAAALAVTVGTVTPTIVAAGATGVKLLDTSITSGSALEITSAATCPLTYTAAGAAGASPWVVSTPTNVAGTSSTFTVPAGPTVGTNGAVKSYQVCAYNGSTPSSSALQSSGTLNLGVAPTLYPNVGATATANQVTVTGGTNGAIFTGVTAPYAVFSTAACPATYGTSPTNTATVTKNGDSAGSVTVPTTVTSGTAASTAYNICLYNGNASTSSLLSFVPYTAVVALPSQTSGPGSSANGPSISISANNSIFAGLTTIGVTFNTAAACPSTYTTPDNSTIINVPTVRKMSDQRIAFTVPSLANNTTFQACVYAGVSNGNSALLAASPYTTTTVQATSGITPAAGPALGGNTITISGTNLPTSSAMITASLGGTPLDGIVAKSSTAFTATAPQHAPGNATLVVTTPAGTSIQNNAYNFTNALKVSPNSAPNNAANVDMTINGVGFLSANWAANTATLAGAHIYLVRGVYDPSSDGSNRANAPLADCTGILVLSDTELACGLRLDRRLDAAGAAVYAPPAPVALTGLSTVNGSRYITTTGSVFTKMMVGMMVGSANLMPNTRIVSVIDDKHALVSANAIAGGSDTGAPIAVAATTMRTTTTSLAAASTAVPAISGGVTSTDVGLTAYGPHINGSNGAGTDVIASTTALTTSGTNSANANEPLDIYTPASYLPVPEGAYNVTFVSNGAIDANSTDPNYQQSAVSSTSTFTVAPF